MLHRIEKGEAQGILAWHPDRLARNSLDGGRIIYMLDTGEIQNLKFVNCPFENTAAGKLNLNMMFSMSKHYVDNLSENIKRGIRQKIRNGIWPNFAPVGYLNDRGSKTIIIDPRRGPLVKQAFEMFATGNYTLAQVRAKINDMGLLGTKGGTLSKGNYHRFLQNPIYCGILRHHGELHQGQHEPLISKALFDRVQEVMKVRSRPKSKASKTYLYKGMFACGECGCTITNERQKGHVYLRCTKKRGPCSQRYIREEEMNRQVSETLLAVSLPEKDADWMIQHLNTQQDRERKDVERAATGIREQIAQCNRKTKRHLDAYEAEVESLEEFRSSKSKLVAERQSLKEKLARLEDRQTNRLEPVFDFLKSSKQAGLAALTDDHAQKRDWLRNAGSNRRVQSGVVSFEPRGAWKLVATSTLLANNPERRVSVARGCLSELVLVPSQAERAGFFQPKPASQLLFVHFTPKPCTRLG